jgi:hypothetical protein
VTLYALVPSSKMASRFNQDLALITKRHGLTPHLGQATDDQGHTLYVLEANGHWMRVWSQNVDLTGHENAATCGIYFEAHPDPGQYTVYLQTTFSFGDSREVSDVGSQIGHELAEAGYVISSKPVLCSSLSKLGGRSS